MLGRFINDARGNIAIITALAAIPLFAVAGGAVDMAGRNSLEASLQKAVDAATLAGAAFEDDREQKIRKIVMQTLETNQSKLAGKVDTKNLDIKVNISSDGVIQVSASTTYKTTLTRVVGINGLAAKAIAEARMGQAGAEIALVLDTTGSMAGSKIATLQEAARQFVDTAFQPNSLRADSVKAAIVPYSQYVNVGTSNRNASWLDMQPSSSGGGSEHGGGNPPWSGCVGSREAPWNLTDGNLSNDIPGLPDDRVGSCPRAITPLTSDQSRLNAEFSALSASGMTYIPAGLIWGWRVLSPQAPFTEGAVSDPTSNKAISKHLVLMTDGQNTLHKPDGVPDHIPGNTSEANTVTSALCENIKSAGITVFTVAFQVNDATTENMLRDCASNPGNYYDADNNSLLLTSFKAIADKIAVIRLAK